MLCREERYLAPQEAWVFHTELGQDELRKPEVHVAIGVARVHLRPQDAVK